ncbi:MAG: ParB N-terminal domain-containing protein [Acidobacteria bacterium]|nr:ParB N-terminal domain-containing protein [Acidobacteriota bacterium]
MNIEMRPTESLKPYEGNPRQNDAAVDAVAASIREFGFRQPIVVDKAGVIVVGHTRWKAAVKLGLAEVPVHVATDLTPDQARAYRIADNATQDLAGWNVELLRLEAAELAGKIDLGQFGLDAAMLAEPVVGQTDPDEVPEPPEAPITKPGELWLLGEHRLLCGDSTKAEDVGRVTNGEKLGAVLADPPYGINYSPGGGGGGILRKDGSRYKKRFTGKDVVRGDDTPFSPTHLLEMNLPMILWGGNHYASRLPDSPSWLVWDKRRGTSVNDFADCELAWTNLGTVARVFAHMWNGMLK